MRSKILHVSSTIGLSRQLSHVLSLGASPEVGLPPAISCHPERTFVPGSFPEQIAEAEMALAGAITVGWPARKMTLHEALAQVLRENGNAPMTARELADAVNARGLYRKRDGSAVEANQVQARTNNYGAIFEKDGSNILLREEAPVLTTHPQTITVFRDDDAGFFDWLEENPEGYFINSERNPKPTFLVLHQARCSHIDRSPSLDWTKEYVKICSARRSDLEEWAVDSLGGEVTLCRSCFG
jgi:hypothetical protein